MEEGKHENEQLKRYKQMAQDIRYILKQYKNTLPEAAWECIRKLVNDPKLRLKNINGSLTKENN